MKSTIVFFLLGAFWAQCFLLHISPTSTNTTTTSTAKAKVEQWRVLRWGADGGEKMRPDLCLVVTRKVQADFSRHHLTVWDTRLPNLNEVTDEIFVYFPHHGTYRNHYHMIDILLLFCPRSLNIIQCCLPLMHTFCSQCAPKLFGNYHFIIIIFSK